MAIDDDVIDALGDAKLVLGGLRHAVFIDRQRNEHRAVAAGKLAQFVGFAFAILEVDRVNDRATRNDMQRLLDDVDLGAVDHHRCRHLLHHRLQQLQHVGGFVATNVGRADIEHVRAFLHLLLGHVQHAFDIAVEHQLAELPAAICIGALANNQRTRVLVERRRMEQRCQLRLIERRTRSRHQALDRFSHRLHVFWRRATATTDDGDAMLFDEACLERREFLRGQVVDRVAADVARQAGVRHDHDRTRRRLAKVANGLLHQVRARRAVEADNVDRHRFERRDGGGDIAADQHRAHRLNRDRAEDRHFLAELFHRITRSDDRQLHLQDVLAGLDVEAVDATGNQALGVFFVGREQLFGRDVADRHELRARPHRTSDEKRLLGRAQAIGNAARQLGGHLVEFKGTVTNIELVEHIRHAAERVGLNDIGASYVVALVDRFDHVGTRLDEQFVAAFEAVEIGERQIRSMDLRAHATVEHEHALG